MNSRPRAFAGSTVFLFLVGLAVLALQVRERLVQARINQPPSDSAVVAREEAEPAPLAADEPPLVEPEVEEDFSAEVMPRLPGDANSAATTGGSQAGEPERDTDPELETTPTDLVSDRLDAAESERIPLTTATGPVPQSEPVEDLVVEVDLRRVAAQAAQLGEDRQAAGAEESWPTFTAELSTPQASQLLERLGGSLILIEVTEEAGQLRYRAIYGLAGSLTRPERFTALPGGQQHAVAFPIHNPPTEFQAFIADRWKRGSDLIPAWTPPPSTLRELNHLAIAIGQRVGVSPSELADIRGTWQVQSALPGFVPTAYRLRDSQLRHPIRATGS
jgi:hypothetical protein